MIEYTDKIKRLFREHGSRVVPLTTDGRQLARFCENCNGSGIVIVFVIKSGPYKSPLDGRRVKWLDARDGIPAGWFDGELVTDTCPVCGGSKYVQGGKVTP